MKLVFHIPSIYIKDGEVCACDSHDFKRELLEKFAEAETGCFFVIQAKKYIMGRCYPFELVVVYEMKGNYYSYVNIFHELVCKYHSELKQRYYCYEQGDALVELKIGGNEDEEGC